MDPSTGLDVLLEISAMIERDQAKSLEAEGLSPARTHLLWVLHQSGPQTQQQLATALEVSPRNVTGLVDGLADTGFATRQAHPEDRRVSLITLTARGETVMQSMATGHEQLSYELFDGLPASFTRHLVRVRDRLRQLVDVP